MPRNPFEQTKTDTTPASGKQVIDYQEETVFPETNQAACKQVAGKEDQNPDRYLMCPGTG